MEAQTKADQMIQAAQHSAAEIQLQATARGRAAALVELTAQHMAFAEQQRRQTEQQLGRSIELAKLLAELLINESLKFDEQLVARLATSALQKLTTRTALRLSVHPDDRAAIARAIETARRPSR